MDTKTFLEGSQPFRHQMERLMKDESVAKTHQMAAAAIVVWIRLGMKLQDRVDALERDVTDYERRIDAIKGVINGTANSNLARLIEYHADFEKQRKAKQ